MALDVKKIEELADAAPQAQDIARKREDEQKKVFERRDDLQRRMFCIEQATKACAAGGYDVPDIYKLAQGFYGFLVGTTTDRAAEAPLLNEVSKRK